jgi:hypothetical protein
MKKINTVSVEAIDKVEGQKLIAKSVTALRDGETNGAPGSQQRAVPSRISPKADNLWRTQCAHWRRCSRNK